VGCRPIELTLSASGADLHEAIEDAVKRVTCVVPRKVGAVTVMTREEADSRIEERTFIIRRERARSVDRRVD
jgi:hypothetical protein